MEFIYILITKIFHMIPKYYHRVLHIYHLNLVISQQRMDSRPCHVLLLATQIPIIFWMHIEEIVLQLA